MPLGVDTASHEFQFLLNQFEKGNVVLFVGAGFSLGAQNQAGTDPPLGSMLGEHLAHACGWPYRDEPLTIVYAQAQRHLGTQQLRERLWNWYHVRHLAEWHYKIPQLIWHRIYSTNIDDVIETAYQRDPKQILLPIVCPSPYVNGDLFLEVVQCVHLHGCVIDFSKNLTFTLDDFARLTALPNPWYQALADDMQSRCFMFVGTKLEESPFHHYLALRSERNAGVAEVRGKAYLIIDSISPIRRRQLQDQNFVVLEQPAAEFFEALVAAVRNRGINERLAVVKNRYPHQIQAIEQGLVEQHKTFLSQFEVVSVMAPSQGQSKSYFFLGGEPTWDDIAAGMDAERKARTPLFEALKSEGVGVRLVVLAGQAGSGKSTLLRRVATNLVAQGETVYFSKSSSRLDVAASVTFLRSIGSRHVYLVVDDAARQIHAITRVTVEAPQDARLTWLLADRPHALAPLLQDLAHLKPVFVEMAPLSAQECSAIVDKLSSFGFLGKLAGRSRHEQIQEFMLRSKKQLLVAMKEATSGRGFDVIISDEFNTLANDETKVAYVIACLAYSQGVPVRRRHLLACLVGTDIEKATVLSTHLRDVVVPWRDSDELLSPRHRVIARQVVREAAPIWIRREALSRFLSQLAGDLTRESITKRGIEYLAYRGLINSDSMLQLFGPDPETIRSIYEAMRPLYGHDFLFYLQYGKAELFFDNFELAENYLHQSIGMKAGGNFQAEHHLGVLYLKRAYWHEDAGLAAEDAAKGEAILRAQLQGTGRNQAYACAALVTRKLKYLSRWPSIKLQEDLEDLYSVAKKGMALTPWDNMIKESHEKAFRAYLSQNPSA